MEKPPNAYVLSLCEESHLSAPRCSLWSSASKVEDTPAKIGGHSEPKVRDKVPRHAVGRRSHAIHPSSHLLQWKARHPECLNVFGSHPAIRQDLTYHWRLSGLYSFSVREQDLMHSQVFPSTETVKSSKEWRLWLVRPKATIWRSCSRLRTTRCRTKSGPW